MANTDIRTLKIFEFNRGLSYVSEIIEIERKFSQLVEEKRLLALEYISWIEESKIAETKEDKEFMDQMADVAVKRHDEIEAMEEDLQNYHNELLYLLSKIMEYVTEEDDENLGLTKEEINESFLEEYVYLLSEPVLDDCAIIFERLLKDKADLAMLVFENYGAEREKLLRDIVNTESDEYLPNCFKDYFPQ